MKVKILGSGSSGNQYIIENELKNQLLIECGIKYKNVANSINFCNVQGLIISHRHLDHALEKDKFEMRGIDVYDHSNLTAGKKQAIGDYDILPIPVLHGDVPNFSFIIKDKISGKKILFCTDLEQMPNVADVEYEFMLLEANYSEDIVEDKIIQGQNFNRNCFKHMSLEKLIEWLSVRKVPTKNLVIIHTSETGLINQEIIYNAVKKYGQKTYIAKKNLEIVSQHTARLKESG